MDETVKKSSEQGSSARDDNASGQSLARRRAKRPSPNEVFQEHGKIPPQALDLEEAVLGAMMLEKDKLSAVIEILQPEVFYKTEHQLIFAAIQRLFGQVKAVDILTVTDELRKSGDLEAAGIAVEGDRNVALRAKAKEIIGFSRFVGIGRQRVESQRRI